MPMSSDVIAYRFRSSGVSLGLMVGREISEHFTVISGLHLVHHSSFGTIYHRNPGSYTGYEQFITLVELPLLVKYRFFKSQANWSPFMQLGLNSSVTAWGLSQRYGQAGYYTDGDIWGAFSLGPMVMAGLEFRLNRRTHLIIQPTFSKFSLVRPTRIFYPDTFRGISVGIYYF
ncbi:MAG: PorT family protein [Bernardetiaceae bacterium]|nr:PorT family protein [Bernardetiaceae bacterium]